MLTLIKNSSSFSDSELVCMVKRENNAKRNYLLVDSKQGKHVPACPSDVIKLFSELAETVREICKNENVLFIGFAETATAVGTVVASCFENAYYIHTTREKNDSMFLVAEFKEEHSHATEQLLYCDDWDRVSAWADRIVFVEDEITTGKTILNFKNDLVGKNKVPENMKFSACSVLNGMTAEREKELAGCGLDFSYLVKISASPESDGAYAFEPCEPDEVKQGIYETVFVHGKKDPRRGTAICEYILACEDLSEEIRKKYSFDGMDVAVIGTEECMYPAISTAKDILENTGAKSVVTHSTTRSPIIAENTDGYPLKSRYRVESLYEDERRTFLYNTDISAYNTVLIITDTEKENICIDRLINAFSLSEKFILVRWVK